MTDKKELNLEEIEKVSGGETIELAGGFKPFISVPALENEEPAVKPVINSGDNKDQKSSGGASGGKGFNNSNNGGKQMNNQGTNNSNGNSGTMNW